MDFNLNANDRSQGWKFSLSHQQAQKSMEKQRKSGRNEMQLKTGREAWKNSKTGILANSWQSVRNHYEFRNVLAISSQPLRISQCVGNQFATLRNSLALVHCTFANFASHIKLQKLSEISHCQLRKPHCQLRKHIANFANHFAKFATHCQLRKPIAKFANHLAKFANHFANFATALPNSQSIAKFASFAKFTFAGLVILCN